MSKKIDRFSHEVAKLVECGEVMRSSVRNFEAAMTEIARRIEAGETAVDAVLESTKPTLRQQMTGAIAGFEEARHQMRVALFDLALEQGSSISEVGRALNISRQLASRLAQEARDQRP